MPRQARQKSNSGIYHIMLRGINRQQIFEDEEDRDRFLETLENYKELCGYTIYAYCLMGNHIHILLKEGKKDRGRFSVLTRKEECVKLKQGDMKCLEKQESNQKVEYTM